MMLLFFIFFIAGIAGSVMIAQDLRSKSVSVWALGIFVMVSMIFGAVTHSSGLFLTLVMASSSSIFVTLAHHNYMGLADALLLPSCYAWLTLDQIPLFLMICGGYALLTAIIWRWRYTQKDYPFVPAILFSLLTLLVS